MQLIRVALNVPLFRFFDYILPPSMYLDTTLSLEVGSRVLVPFGRQKKVAIVVDFPKESEVPSHQLKPIIACLDQQSVFNPSLWKLLHWAANYYQAPLGEALLQALPVKLRQEKNLENKIEAGNNSLNLKNNNQSAVKNQQIFLHLTELGKKALKQNLLQRAKKQQAALHALLQAPLEKANNPFSSAIWSSLLAKGYVEEIIENLPVLSWQQKIAPNSICREDNKLLLNHEQDTALKQIEAAVGFHCWLINGITGSGKTEIYLQLIENILQQGKQVLVLVPEIGLTPQTVQRFQSRFNVPIEVLHSNLNDSQRLQVWQKMKSGQSAVVIGTRSALFTQFQNLGLIVIDEEHDASFKQQEGWRYHARDLAVVYAKQLNIPIVLGSATPSLESLHNAKLGKYQQIHLTQKAENSTALRQMVIDLKHQQIQNGLSNVLLSKIQQHLNQGNQVLLFLNRRGFAPVLFCHECGWIAQCTDCEKPYTYHQYQRILRCHHCGSQKTIPRQCGECGSTHLLTTGLGTEQLEESLSRHFPQYQISRIDRDSTARKGKLEQHLADIQQGKSQILIGTQILAKGHHFPNVTLVALLNIDGALFSIDFRAEERLAQLYTQVAGRAGRGSKSGEVILQTHYPEHPLLRTLLREHYNGFAEQALIQRKLIGLPPFTAQVLFKAQSRQTELAEQFLQQLSEYFYTLMEKENIQGLQLLGPIPAPMHKKAGYFRWQLLLQHPSKGVLQQLLATFPQDEWKSSQVHWVLDIDPIDHG